MFMRQFVGRLCLRHNVALHRDGDMLKLMLDGCDPLTIERVGDSLLVGHSFSRSNKLIRTPEFVFYVLRDQWLPVSWRCGDALIECGYLDEDLHPVQVDPVKSQMISNEAEKFARRLAAQGWLERGAVNFALVHQSHRVAEN